ncbi:PTS sugar transporter subunit IIA [Tropicimonas sp. S265A]|uniref:PTS sugar transporter subunit IIA n=1 Tax=Tropicimonas sp. S265A TaxID=3415134 RepID=UPI003C7BD606
MDLSDLVAPKAIRVLGQMSSKKRLMQELSDIACQAYEVCLTDAVDALQERESLGPTGVGGGVALPHARLADIDRVVGVFVRLEKPMDFDSVDRQPVDLIFALFAPEDSGVEHLKALALVSRTLRDPAVCAKLRANAEPSTLHAILTETEQHRAA